MSTLTKNKKNQDLKKSLPKNLSPRHFTVLKVNKREILIKATYFNRRDKVTGRFN